MARTGIYKTDVQKARDTLLAQGLYPSVDAVRIALGNTGSKTTIHRYLKELDEEDGGAKDRKTSLSEALQDLVERLAARLQEEANAQVDAIRAAQAEQERRHADVLTAAKTDIQQLTLQLQRTEKALAEEQGAHAAVREALQRETVARHTSEQHAADLKERLAENESHRQSLEEKHRHAREALEHYRQSVKDQRDQDQRRHEQQVQQLQSELRQAQQTVVVRQEEVTRLNQEGARLVSELSHAQKALYDEQTHVRRLEQKIEALQAAEQRAAILMTQLQERDQQLQQLREQLKEQAVTSAASAAQKEALSERARTLELELTTAQIRLAAQLELTNELRKYARHPDQVSGPTPDQGNAEQDPV